MVHRPTEFATVVLALFSHGTTGFAPSSTARISTTNAINNCNHWQQGMLPSSSSTCLRSTNGNDGSSSKAEEEAQRLREKANQYRNEAEKLRLTLGIQKIEGLEKDIREFMNGDDAEASSSDSRSSEKREADKLKELRTRVQDLVRGSLGKEEADNMLASLSAFSSTSTFSDAKEGEESAVSTLTEEELYNAISLLSTLPKPVKDTLAKAAGYPDYDTIPSMKNLVNRLYEKNKDISTEELRRLYFQSFSENLPAPTSMAGSTKKRTAKDELDEEYELLGVSKMLANKLEEVLDNSTRAMELFPRNVQEADDSVLPTEADADVIFQLLDKSFMATQKPVKVQGGYIIRGTNKRKTAGELLDVVDGKLAKTNPEWTEKYQVSFVELYSDADMELFEDAILITPNKFASMAPKLLAGVVTAVTLFFSFVFCIDAFGENPIVMEKLKEATELAQNGGAYDITWFNELLVPLLVTLGAAQGVHEVAHYAVAWTKQVRHSVSFCFLWFLSDQFVIILTFVIVGTYTR